MDACAGKDCSEEIGGLRFLAERGNADAARRLGNLYYDGVGIERDYAEAVRWYGISADTGDQWCRNRLGEMHRDGKGMPEDPVEAYERFSGAAAFGNTGAIGNILNLYSANLMDRDSRFEEYLNRMKGLADAGNADAARRVGNIYHDGSGVRRDYAEAAEWYRKAALLGDRWCMNRLGEMR